MAAIDPNTDFWSLTPSRLASQCALIAQGSVDGADDADRAEAANLVTEWQEALDMPIQAFEDRERQAAQVGALRKRTIEILVRVSNAG
ncbi:MAG: hypothetical protein WCE75_03575 [Terracidiphilus sp.]